MLTIHKIMLQRKERFIMHMLKIEKHFLNQSKTHFYNNKKYYVFFDGFTGFGGNTFIEVLLNASSYSSFSLSNSDDFELAKDRISN